MTVAVTVVLVVLGLVHLADRRRGARPHADDPDRDGPYVESHFHNDGFSPFADDGCDGGDDGGD